MVVSNAEGNILEAFLTYWSFPFGLATNLEPSVIKKEQRLKMVRSCSVICMTSIHAHHPGCCSTANIISMWTNWLLIQLHLCQGGKLASHALTNLSVFSCETDLYTYHSLLVCYTWYYGNNSFLLTHSFQ